MKVEILEILETMLGTCATSIITDEDAIEYGGDGIFYSQFDESGVPCFEIQSTDRCKVSAGCTRLVLIPEDKDYVIKLPIMTVGSITYDIRIDKSEYEDYNEFATSEDENFYYISDFSEAEYLTYYTDAWEILAKKFTPTRRQIADLMDEENAYFDDEPILRKVLLENTYEGSFNGIPVYTQKKAVTYRAAKVPFEEISYEDISYARNILSPATRGETFPEKWALDCINAFGEADTNKMLEVIHEFGIDVDMTWENFGYLPDGKPCIFDAAGYYEDNVWQKLSN